MSTKSGVLTITSNESRLDDGTLLARCNDSSPLSAGTAFLTGLGFQSGDRIRVTGTDGTIGSVAVFCMTAAVREVQLAVAAQAVGAAKRTPKKAARKGAASAKKKAATKKRPATKKTRKSSKDSKKKARTRP